MTTPDDPADGLDTREAGQSGCRYHGSRRGRGDGHRPKAECVPALRPLGAGVIVVHSVRPGLRAWSCSSTPGRFLRPAAAARGLSRCTGYEYDAASSRLCLERGRRRQSQHECGRRPANGGHCHCEPLHPSLRWRGAGTGLIRLSPGVRPVWRVDLGRWTQVRRPCPASLFLEAPAFQLWRAACRGDGNWRPGRTSSPRLPGRLPCPS